MKLSPMHHQFSERSVYMYIVRYILHKSSSFNQQRWLAVSVIDLFLRRRTRTSRVQIYPQSSERYIRNVALCLLAGCKLIIARIYYAVWRSRARSPRYTYNLLTVHQLRGKSAHSSSTRYNFSVICCVTLFRRIARTLRGYALDEFLEKTEIPSFFLNFSSGNSDRTLIF